MNPVFWRTWVVAIAVRIPDPPIPCVGNHFSPDALAEFASARERLCFGSKIRMNPNNRTTTHFCCVRQISQVWYGVEIRDGNV